MQRRQREDGAGAEHPIPFRIGPSAVLLIFGFWTVFAAVTLANEVVSPFGPPRPFRREIVSLTFLGAYVWAAITPLALWFIGRYSLDQGNRARRAVVYVLVAIGFTVLVSFVLALGGNWILGASLHQSELEAVLGAPGPMPPLPFSNWLLTLIRYRFVSDLMASLLVLTAGLAYNYFRHSQLRQAEATLLREQLVESRLQVLRAQLNPHFLFNTLNAVSALVARDPSGVRRMIARLGEVLRYSLEGSQEQVIRLEQELDILRRYLEILEIRYQGRLVTAIAAEPETLDALVPTLILQPLAENAVTHGVGLAGGHGRIEVHAQRAAGELILAVRDTGAGAGAEAEPSERGMGGVGLRHIRQRLEQLYGSAYRLELRPRPEGGTVAEVVLPFHAGVPTGEKKVPQRA